MARGPAPLRRSEKERLTRASGFRVAETAGGEDEGAGEEEDGGGQREVSVCHLCKGS